MTKYYRALVAGLCVANFASNAFAGTDTFETTFTYNKHASMVSNYQNFERTAKLACRAEVGRDGRQSLAISAKLEQKCEAELLTKVVNATRSEILIAHHQEKLTKARG